MKATLLAAGLGLAAVCAIAGQESHTVAPKPVTVEFKNAQGQSVGTALLTETPHGVKIKLDIKNLPPGEHSIHIHQTPKCDPPDFKSAGPHFDSVPAGHAEHDHSALPAGDIPNFSLVVGADGTSHVSVVAPNVTLSAGEHSVLSNGGTAIVIHAVAGGSGTGAPARIACGIVSKSE